MSFFRKKQPSASTLGPPAGSSTMTTTVPMNAGGGGAQVTVAQTPSQALAQLKAAQASGGEPQMTGMGKENDA